MKGRRASDCRSEQLYRVEPEMRMYSARAKATVSISIRVGICLLALRVYVLDATLLTA
jgi:hypothetical protein